ncbi:MAG TPA: hypothetical protein VGY55_24760 [Pirellulales bacterium]|jgi:hypothetical protein|nr:hypothetical protein [Pirellulales bacterium]
MPKLIAICVCGFVFLTCAASFRLSAAEPTFKPDFSSYKKLTESLSKENAVLLRLSRNNELQLSKRLEADDLPISSTVKWKGIVLKVNSDSVTVTPDLDRPASKSGKFGGGWGVTTVEVPIGAGVSGDVAESLEPKTQVVLRSQIEIFNRSEKRFLEPAFSKLKIEVASK